MLMPQSVSVSANAATELEADEQRLAWVNGTIFGRDVVPEVRSSSATSEGLAQSCSAVRPSAERLKTPDSASGAIDNSTMLICKEWATRRAAESIPAWRINARGRKSVKYRFSSSTS